jgi:hypothetical protein
MERDIFKERWKGIGSVEGVEYGNDGGVGEDIGSSVELGIDVGGRGEGFVGRSFTFFLILATRGNFAICKHPQKNPSSENSSFQKV